MRDVKKFLGELWEAIKEAGYFILLALKALRFWRRDPPVLTVGELARFAETRSKFVSQITLFGYVKTRAGTRYTSLFEDDVFADSLNIAKWEIYLACLGDLSIYTTAKALQPVAAANPEATALAIHIFDLSIRDEEVPKQRPQGFDDVIEAFHGRAEATDWSQIGQGENSFASSLDALVEWAPIADELKIHDVQIVRNSMRFRWKSVRDQFEISLDADTVAAEWRAQGNTSGSEVQEA